MQQHGAIGEDFAALIFAVKAGKQVVDHFLHFRAAVVAEVGPCRRGLGAAACQRLSLSCTAVLAMARQWLAAAQLRAAPQVRKSPVSTCRKSDLG